MKQSIVIRLLSFALAVVLLCGTAAAAGMENFSSAKAYDGRFVDVSGWYREYVIAAYESGLVNGVTDREYAPETSLNLNAAVTLAARIHKLYYAGNADFAEVSQGDWYRPYYDYCIANGLFAEDQLPYSQMTKAATRNQVIAAFSRVLPAEELQPINDVPDGAIPDVPAGSAYAPAIYAFYRAGVLTGDERHFFHGSSTIRRSEIAAIVTRLTGLSPRSRVNLQTASAEQTAGTDSLTVGGKTYSLGMPEADARRLAGEPRETVRSTDGCTVLIYADADGGNTLMIGVDGGTVRSLYGVGTGFSWNGLQAGSVSAARTEQFSDGAMPYSVSVLSDDFDSGKVYGVLLRERGRTFHVDAVSNAGEVRINFYGVNAFRRYHGLPLLTYSDAAAAVAGRYSRYMAESGFFDHRAPDGTSAADRLNAAGISWRHCAENLYMGTDTLGLEILDGWINSVSGHRKPILDTAYTHLGIGAYGADDGGWMTCYWTQNFHN